MGGGPGISLSLLFLKNQLKIRFPKGTLQDGPPVAPSAAIPVPWPAPEPFQPMPPPGPLSLGAHTPSWYRDGINVGLRALPLLLCPHLNLSTSAGPLPNKPYSQLPVDTTWGRC